MELIKLIQNRRSCRIYSDRKMESKKVEALMKAVLWAPSSKNNRPWEFILVEHTGSLRELAQCKPHGAAFIANAPLAIVILADPEKSDVWIEDTAIAASYLQLAAEDLGLGSCWIQVRERHYESGITASERIKKQLNVPAHLEVASIITVGYKGKERRPYSDEDLLKDRIHINSF